MTVILKWVQSAPVNDIWKIVLGALFGSFITLAITEPFKAFFANRKEKSKKIHALYIALAEVYAEVFSTVTEYNSEISAQDENLKDEIVQRSIATLKGSNLLDAFEAAVAYRHEAREVDPARRIIEQISGLSVATEPLERAAGLLDANHNILAVFSRAFKSGDLNADKFSLLIPQMILVRAVRGVEDGLTLSVVHSDRLKALQRKMEDIPHDIEHRASVVPEDGM